MTSEVHGSVSLDLGLGAAMLTGQHRVVRDAATPWRSCGRTPHRRHDDIARHERVRPRRRRRAIAVLGGDHRCWRSSSAGSSTPTRSRSWGAGGRRLRAALGRVAGTDLRPRVLVHGDRPGAAQHARHDAHPAGRRSTGRGPPGAGGAGRRRRATSAPASARRLDRRRERSPSQPRPRAAGAVRRRRCRDHASRASLRATSSSRIPELINEDRARRGIEELARGRRASRRTTPAASAAWPCDRRAAS